MRISTMAFAESQFASLFREHRLPVPTRLTYGSNILAQMLLVLKSDMLAMVPHQWIDFAGMNRLVQRIPVREYVGGPSIGLMRRADLPLTPAAEYFCALARRAASRMPNVRAPRGDRRR